MVITKAYDFTSQFFDEIGLNHLTVPSRTSVPFTTHLFCSSSRLYTSTFTLEMAPNQKQPYLGALSSPPALACPYCLRHFKSKSGRTRHILSKHPVNRSESQARDSTAHRSPIPSSPPPSFHHPSPSTSHVMTSPPIPSLPLPSFHNPSPSPSRFMSSPPPSCHGFNADANIDIEHPHNNVSPITRVFHPTINGRSIFILHIH